jgi:hypothetical protein
MKKYKISIEDRLGFISLVLLNEIINFQHYFKVKSEGDDKYLDTYLRHMLSRGVLEIKDNCYIPTEMGRGELLNLYNKYHEYLKLFDIYCAVDLEDGEFAFSKILDPLLTDLEWETHINNPSFSDIRVAVADFKGINPIEMVFLSYLNENKFDCVDNDWQFNLTSENIWLEIEEICNSAISVDYLSENGVLEDVIKQGTEIAIKLIKDSEGIINTNGDEANTNNDDVDNEEITYVEIVEEPIYDYYYYEPYYDPFYISPIWLAPMLLF